MRGVPLRPSGVLTEASDKWLLSTAGSWSGEAGALEVLAAGENGISGDPVLEPGAGTWGLSSHAVTCRREALEDIPAPPPTGWLSGL